MPCSAYSLFTRARCLRVVCALLLWLSCVCFQSSWLHLPTLPIVGRVWSLCCYGARWGHCRLIVGQCQLFNQMPAFSLFAGGVVTWNYRALFLCFLRGFRWWVQPAVKPVVLTFRVLFLPCPMNGFYWWVGLGVRSDVCLQPISGAAVEVMCVVVLPRAGDTLEWCWSLPG